MKKEYIVVMKFMVTNDPADVFTIIYGEDGSIGKGTPFKSEEDAKLFLQKKNINDEYSQVVSAKIYERFVNPWICADDGTQL